MAVNNAESKPPVALPTIDIESQRELESHDTTIVETPTPGNEGAGMRDNSNVPHLSLLKLFWFFFYNFGLFAWGGPVAQIALHQRPTRHPR